MIQSEELKKYLEDAMITELTEVQSKTLPLITEGHSVKVLAQTGSGKTLAYILPIVQLLKDLEKIGTQELDKGAPKCVILSPTRELGRQIFQIFKSISHFAKLKVRFLGAGDGVRKSKNLKLESFDVLVAGPQKMLQLIEDETFTLKDTRFLIMDEADQLLDMGFMKTVGKIFAHCKNDSLQVGLFSATMPEKLEEYIDKYFNRIDFKNIRLQDVNKIQHSVETFNIHLKVDEKNPMVKEFLAKEARGKGIIFLNRKQDAEKLYEFLAEGGAKKTYLLHGDMAIKDRKKSIADFQKSGAIMVATDILARGMDIAGLAWVLNYDLPFEAVYYVHRSGRVGRQKDKGMVYNFVTPRDSAIISRINTAISDQSSIKLSPIKEKSKSQRPGPVHKKKTDLPKLKRSPRFKRKKK